MVTACSIRVRGVVQGVGFRPFVYRLATANRLAGWVLNGDHGVEIHLEGDEPDVAAFVEQIQRTPPPAAQIAELLIESAASEGLGEFTIRDSNHLERPTVRVSPDLAICDECLDELFDPENHRYLYPYINCTNCGPRYSVILALPYDRPNTTMRDWPMDRECSREYHDPISRRFHAQPIACEACGPNYLLYETGGRTSGEAGVVGIRAIEQAARLLRQGDIVAVKGAGGYHLACDARNSIACTALRERKFRKEKPFAVMAKNLETARNLLQLSSESEALLTSQARPIVLGEKKHELAGVAPDNADLGVMLPYAPLHHLLFAAGAPDTLVMTSANRSSEPIAYEDDDALDRLSAIADAFLIGQRPIARRIDDSVVRAGSLGPVILRRARGYAPGVVARLPTLQPILALGADLKNTITLAVEGQAFVSQHIGDLDHESCLRAFQNTVNDLVSMYGVRFEDLMVVHDAHPEYASSLHASLLPATVRFAVQHHRAHLASVIAERGEWQKTVVGVSLDGTGYGDDGSIWGGEIFAGSAQQGFQRVAHLRPAALPGGDAAARFPIQAAAGFLSQLEGLPDLTASPFCFGRRYLDATQLVERGVRTFSTTSMGRLFDAASALLGFARESTFEGQAAIWLEQQARGSSSTNIYPFPFDGRELDFRPLLDCVIHDRMRGYTTPDIARAFQRGIAHGLLASILALCERYETDTVVLSGGVFQNELLLADMKLPLEAEKLQVWTNHLVPPNDGGISLGQAALAAFAPSFAQGVSHA